MRKTNRFLRYLAGSVIMFSMVFGLMTAAMPETVQAASGFVEANADMIGQGGYIYYIKMTGKADGAAIYRMKVTTAEKSKVIEAERGIVRMTASGQYLYYTTYNESGNWEIWRCTLSGGDAAKVCDGRVCYVDGTNLYGLKYVNGRGRLFYKNLESGKSTSVRTVKSGQVLDYVCNLGNDSYYYIYNQSTDKIVLYRLAAGSTKLTKIAAEKRSDNQSQSALLVSDVRQINGELYYDYGSYEGSGNYWYGTIKKLTVDGKKKVVGKNVGNDEIVAGSRELYFTDSAGNTYYKYNLNTGKKETYSLDYQKGINYIILGDKTYMADTSDKKKITISRFNSGTAKETLTNNFISFAFKQKANVTYTVRMKQVGIYNMVCVIGTDYTDASYGWRGKLVSIDWFITDGAGTVLGSFS